MEDILPHGCRPWLVLAVALIGNCGFWLYWYNRINATGVGRTTTKRAEKAFVVLCFLIPLVIGLIEHAALAAWLGSKQWWPADAALFRLYGGWCVASFFVMGSMWIASRRFLIPPVQFLSESHELHDVHAAVGGTPATPVTRFLMRIPGNEIGQLSVTRKELLVRNELEKWNGFRIGHISDIHLTGQYRLEHHQFVVDRLLELEADILVVSGDIIDYERYIPCLEPLLSRLRAPLGVFFVLGNHDRRLPNMETLSTEITRLGLEDLGLTNRVLDVPGRGELQLLGNEHPWLERHSAEALMEQEQFAHKTPGHELRIGVSHTPDRIPWARRCRCDLLFSGHTHGGQMRLPVVGPLLAPSLHGSQFASGVFYLKPTLVHVSRGVAGTHPLRWRCPPEISLLTLRNAVEEGRAL